MPLLPDYLFTTLLALLIGFFLQRYARRQQLAGRGAQYQWLLPAYGAKLLGFAAAMWILASVYQGQSDAVVVYYRRAMQLRELLAGQPYYLFKYAFWGLDAEEMKALSLPYYYGQLKGTNQLVRFSLCLSYLCNGRFLLMSFAGTLLAFWGTWRLFLLGHALYPQAIGAWALPTLFLPSVLYWGGGLSKEAFVLLGLPLLLSGFYQVFLRPQARGRASFGSLLLGGFLLATIKVYLLLLLLPALGLWYVLEQRRAGALSLRALLPRAALAFSAVALLFCGLVYIYPYFGSDLPDNVALQLNHWRSMSMVNSSFSLPQMQPTIGDFLWHYPLLLSTALFRPFLWEAQHALVALAALETLLVLLLSIITLLRVGFLSAVKQIGNDPFLLSISSFLLLFFPLITLGSGNFGTLVRYKLPGIVLYIMLLLLVGQQAKKS